MGKKLIKPPNMIPAMGLNFEALWPTNPSGFHSLATHASLFGWAIIN